MGFVYFFLNSNDNSIKIGFTKNMYQRKKSLATGSSGKLVLLGYIQSDNAVDLEKQLHIQFEKYKIRRNGEWFNSDISIVNYINKNNNMQQVFVDWNDKRDKLMVYKTMKK